MSSYLAQSTLSHGQRVRRLYKEALNTVRSYYYFRHLYRYHAVLLRARFEENKELDPVEAKRALEAGEEELFQKSHPQPFKFPNSPAGSAYGRDSVTPPDWNYDLWHPLERAAYPEYFAKREQRKKEYIEAWEKKHGKMATDH